MNGETPSAQGNNATASSQQSPIPSIALPKGGGAIRGIGEKFTANPVTGTGSLSIPLATSPGRAGFGPQLSLSYDSGTGNGPFGVGWNLSLPSITRKTDKGLPQYRDAEESDVFILSGSEDLVPAFTAHTTQIDETLRDGYRVRRYRPRVEGLFARIERWTRVSDSDTHWRSISKDNVLTVYGWDSNSRIVNLTEPSQVFSWLICHSYDDKGNAILYEYAAENDANVDRSQANERNRAREANRYLKSVRYGNRLPLLVDVNAPNFRTSHLQLPDFSRAEWMFEVVFDYDEGHYRVALQSVDELARVSITPTPTTTWPVRPDPFSQYRSGFEVRTYRLCHRVLMFHHFPDELHQAATLVRATEFSYAHGSPAGFSFISHIVQSGFSRYADDIYIKQSLPPLEFTYSGAKLQSEIHAVDTDSVQNLPLGLDGARYQWVDLDGEGLSGILTEQAEGWFYKRNVSPLTAQPQNGHETISARFAAVDLVVPRPSLAGLSTGQQQFLDLAGDGQLELVQFAGPTPGFFTRTADECWQPFVPFTTLPSIAWDNPNLKFIDLTGDGQADILIGEDDTICWYRSRAEAGFGPPERLRTMLDEEKGPKLLFADGSQSLYLADLSGDGLTDLVRIRNGEVCYWPNLGYGRFGAKVTMDNAPWFDRPEVFDHKRIRLADIDGSGPTDILYLHADGVRLYFNQSGNGWSEATQLSNVPTTDAMKNATVVDLLGNGTACLVWSSPLLGDARCPMQYLDLLGGHKPHLLLKVVNNLGAETHIHYAPSTKFYLNDKYAGKPWISKLPFPVHVVEQVETLDHISRNRFVTRYAYHHGYFDGTEREFRGFGMVEQWDTEELATLNQTTVDSDTSSPVVSVIPPAINHRATPQRPINGAQAGFIRRDSVARPSMAGNAVTNQDVASHIPPVLTRTWFHTGVYVGRETVSNFFAGLLDHQDGGEYYREPNLTDQATKQQLLDDTILPSGLTTDEEREACRALKGAMLRQEVYALDGTAQELHPYTVTEQNFTIERIQPEGNNRHAVFFTHPREAISYHYERNPVDPRVSHTLTLEVDDYGNVRKALSIGYGRRQVDTKLAAADQRTQATTLITYTESDVTNAIDSDSEHYRTPLPSAVRTYELTGFQPDHASGRFSFAFWARDRFKILASAQEIAYEQTADHSQPQKRIIEHMRTRYRSNDLMRVLPQGEIESLALPGESYKLAFTPGLLAQVYRRILSNQSSEPLLPNPAEVFGGTGGDQGGYVDLDGDSHWWIAAGQVFYDSNVDVVNPATTAARERAEARQHFFVPRVFVDPFKQRTRVTYDRHDLLVEETVDAMGNAMSARNDYRVLQPQQVNDANGNRSHVVFDALGMVAGTAVMGKEGENLGDTLDEFVTDLTPAQRAAFHQAGDPHLLAVDLLKGATTRIVYDVDRFSRSRQTFPHDPGQWQPVYAATLARETHVSDPIPPGGVKIQLSFSYSDGFGREIQKKIQAEPETPGGAPRWVGSGWVIFNNKGKPVRQYEPFFSATHHFEFAQQVGVSPVLFYDPAERVVATLHPNHTYEKVRFDPWQQTTWDVNDTVTLDPHRDPDVAGYVRAYFATQPADWQTWREQRQDGALGADEQAAATQTTAHANTPTTAYFDTLGRPFLTLAHNGFAADGTPIVFPSRIELDIESNQRAVSDAKERVVMRYSYDLLGNRIHQASMEAGERWMLNDVTGKVIRAWNSRRYQVRTEYDALRRPLQSFVQGGDPAERNATVFTQEIVVARTIYGDSSETGLSEQQQRQVNLRGKVYQQRDGAGVVTTDRYDFKGNLLRSSRQFARDYKGTLDWSRDPALEQARFVSTSTFDALNRATAVTTPDGSVYRPTYNDANLLDAVTINLRGAQQNGQPQRTPFVTNIDYNAKGQRARIVYGNGAETTYRYDPETFHLLQLTTTRKPGQDGVATQLFSDARVVQDLRYTYDPTGNITQILDAALTTVFHNNQQVEPRSRYSYDPLYRLIEASGREHIAQSGFQFAPSDGNQRDYPLTGAAHLNDLQALRNYSERYDYDAVGNFERMLHQAVNGNWTREYAYEEASLLEPSKPSNRLSRTVMQPNGNQPVNEPYSHDVHGNMTTMPHLSMLQWDFGDQLSATSRQVTNNGTAEITYYVYDGNGQRVRKITERNNGSRKNERYYIGGFEVYREYNGNGASITLERETLQVMDDKQRLALVETKILDASQPPPPSPRSAISLVTTLAPPASNSTTLVH